MIRSVIRVEGATRLAHLTLGVAGGPETPVLGPVSRLARLGLLVPAWLWVRTLWNLTPGRSATPWRLAAAWFAFSSLTLASVAVLGNQALTTTGGRQAVVIRLNALLVGFVTGSLALFGSHDRPNPAIRYHHVALVVMLGGLVGAQFGAVRPGMWVAAGGAAVLWSTARRFGMR